MAREHLLDLFGTVIAGKIRDRPTWHQMPGKHYRGKHPRISGQPAGSKLFKQFYQKTI